MSGDNSTLLRGNRELFLRLREATHLMDGHWIGFEVKDNLQQAVAIVYDVDRMLEAYASKRE